MAWVGEGANVGGDSVGTNVGASATVGWAGTIVGSGGSARLARSDRQADSVNKLIKINKIREPREY